MAIQMLKLVFNINRNTNMFYKCSHSIHYISNVSSQNIHKKLLSNHKVLVGYFSTNRNFSKRTQNFTSTSHQQIVTNKIFKGLLCNKETVLAKRASIDHFSGSVNNVRQYSSSAPATEALKYNDGIFQMISESICVEWVTEAFRLIHYQVGLPWWATIIISAVITRAFIHLPLTVFDLHNRAKQENLKPELIKIANRIKMEARMAIQSHEMTPQQAASLCKYTFDKERKELYQIENCHPLKGMVVLCLHAPIWICSSVALRNMCYMLPAKTPATFQDYVGLSEGGFGWMQDLTHVDHFFVIPILFSLSGLMLLEINQVLYNVKQDKFRKILKNVVRVVYLCFVPVVSFMPCSLALYWTTNNVCIILQSLLLLSPKVRRIGRIPKTDSELQQPYEELHKRFLSIFSLKKSVIKA